MKKHMAYKTPYNDPEFVRIKEKYRGIKAPYKEAIVKLEQLKENLWLKSWEHNITSRLNILHRIPIHIAVVGGFILFFISMEIGIIGFIVYLLLLSYYFLANIVSNRAKERVLNKNSEIILKIDHEIEKAQKVLDELNRKYGFEWDQACEDYSSYPPDWKERCEIVKNRDGYKCTTCGYPDGFQRMSRDLHVHHKIALSDGGNNAISNLITLCHICHRKIDHKHARIKKIRKTKRDW